MEEYTSIILLLTSIAAYFIKGLVGFGPSLIIVPVLSIFFDFRFAVIIATLADITSSTFIFYKERKKIQLKRILSIIIGLAIGTFIGTSLFQFVPITILQKLFGSMIIIIVLKSFFEKRKKQESFNKIKAFFSGLVGGIFGGLLNTNGPPIVVYLNKVMQDKTQLRATLSAVFAADALWRGMLFWRQGLLTIYNVQIFSYFVLPGLIIGLFLGNIFMNKIDDKKVTSLIEAILFIVGFGLIF